MANKHGSVKALIGSMYSGKSTLLLHYLKRAQIGNKRILLFKPKVDNRYSTSEVVSHDGLSFPAEVIDGYKALYEVSGVDIVFVDEIQFFDAEIWRAVNHLATEGIDVVVAGLSTDYMGQPFEASARIAMIADTIEKLTAVCPKCGEDAVWTQMVVDGVEVTDGERVQVGGKEMYEPRCRKCFVR